MHTKLKGQVTRDDVDYIVKVQSDDISITFTVEDYYANKFTATKLQNEIVEITKHNGFSMSIKMMSALIERSLQKCNGSTIEFVLGNPSLLKCWYTIVIMNVETKEMYFVIPLEKVIQDETTRIESMIGNFQKQYERLIPLQKTVQDKAIYVENIIDSFQKRIETLNTTELKQVSNTTIWRSSITINNCNELCFPINKKHDDTELIVSGYLNINGEIDGYHIWSCDGNVFVGQYEGCLDLRFSMFCNAVLSGIPKGDRILKFRFSGESQFEVNPRNTLGAESFIRIDEI